MSSIFCWFFSTGLGRSIELQALTNLVTSSLSLLSKRVFFMPHDKALETFAWLTAKHLPNATSEQKKRLYDKAYRFGRYLRLCHIDRSNEKLKHFVFCLYRNIGIEMSGLLPGDVIVERCYFSCHYSPALCATASLMDAGVICGLYGGGDFRFSERITEGHNVCRCKKS